MANKYSSKGIELAIAGLLLMGGEWVLLVASTHPHEMIVGACSVLAAGVFLRHAHRSEILSLHFTLRDTLAVWRLPWYVLSGIWEITLLLFKDLFGRRTGSFYRVSGFATSKDDPTLVARRVLATAYTSAAPNFIVIGIDFRQSRMLFHQIERSSIPEMAQELGAKP